MFSQQKYNKKYKDITKTTIPKECRLEYCEFTLGEKEPSETGHWPLAQCVKKTKSVFLVIPSFSTLHNSPVFCSFPGLTPCEDKASNPPLNTTSTSTQTSPSCSWSTDQSLRHSPIVPLWSSDHPIPTHFTFWISTLSTTGGVENLPTFASCEWPEKPRQWRHTKGRKKRNRVAQQLILITCRRKIKVDNNIEDSWWMFSTPQEKVSEHFSYRQRFNSVPNWNLACLYRKSLKQSGQLEKPHQKPQSLLVRISGILKIRPTTPS